MKINFSELLASERIRPLWGRSFTQDSAADELERLLRTHGLQGGESEAASPQGVPRSAAGGGPGDVHRGASSGAASDAAVDRTAESAAAGSGQTRPGGQAGVGEGAEEGHGASHAAGADAVLSPPDLADLPIRPPHEIFADLERAVQGDLGNRATMVRNFIEALRVRVHSVDPTADAALYHPMRHAAGGTIWELLGRMEDTLSGLRRVAAGR